MGEAGSGLGRAYRYLDPRAAARMGKINLVARGVVEGFVTGLHKSPYHGFSAEFSEHRAYAPGDDPRRIDWKSFARNDRYVVKLYENETNVRCYVLLDKSASMGYGSGELTKLEYSCYLAGCLSYLMIKQQDSVGLVSFDEGVGRFIAPRSAPSHLSVLLGELEKVKAGEGTGIAKTFHDLAERIGVEFAAGDVCDAPVALGEDRVGAIDHDFLHVRIREHGLQRTEVVVQYLDRVFVGEQAHRMPPHVRGWNSFVISPEDGAPC